MGIMLLNSQFFFNDDSTAIAFSVQAGRCTNISFGNSAR